MANRKYGMILVAASLAASTVALADSPQHERHDLMEHAGKAAKVVGSMLRGEAEYDSAAAMESLQTFKDVSGKFGELFPVGSETGDDTRAAPAIWEDRDGFNAALQDWVDATAAAID
ncbi:MAG: cytochrome c, partial [Planctomycetes bacterium]|nr:cytochrome c [Planctomycetota bacterium]